MQNIPMFEGYGGCSDRSGIQRRQFAAFHMPHHVAVGAAGDGGNRYTGFAQGCDDFGECDLAPSCCTG